MPSTKTCLKGCSQLKVPCDLRACYGSSQFLLVLSIEKPLRRRGEQVEYQFIVNRLGRNKKEFLGSLKLSQNLVQVDFRKYKRPCTGLSELQFQLVNELALAQKKVAAEILRKLASITLRTWKRFAC